MTKRIVIDNGPSELKMIVSLTRDKIARDREIAFSVTFTDAVHKKYVTVLIDKMEREDGSGHSWLIGGQTIDSERWFKFEGYYSSTNRRGEIRVEQ